VSGEGRFRRTTRIGRRSAHDLVLTTAKYGDHGPGPHPRFQTDAEVKRFYERAGLPFQEVVERCRDFTRPVPMLENLLDSSHVFVQAGGGGSVAVVDSREEEIAKLEEPGVLVMSSYQHLFQTAAKALDRAIEEGSWGEFLSALSNGIASIEAYLNHRAEQWNKRHPEEQLLDSKASKVSFEQKIEVWVPKMTRGGKLDRSDEVWRDFLVLRSLRDHEAIHPKRAVGGVTYQQMAEHMNRFRSGIGMLLVRLHLLFNERIPSRLVRAAYAPNVEVVLGAEVSGRGSPRA